MLESASRGGGCAWAGGSARGGLLGGCLVQGDGGVCSQEGIWSGGGVCSRGVLLLEGSVCSGGCVSALGGVWSGGRSAPGGSVPRGAALGSVCLLWGGVWSGGRSALGGSAPRGSALGSVCLLPGGPCLVWRGVCSGGVSAPRGVDTLPHVDRILDTRLSKYYLGPTSLRPVIIGWIIGLIKKSFHVRSILHACPDRTRFNSYHQMSLPGSSNEQVWTGLQ